MKSSFLLCLLALTLAAGCSFKGGADDAIQQQADDEFTQQKNELNPLVGTWTGNMVGDDHSIVPLYLNVYTVTSSDARDPSGRRIQRADPGATIASTADNRYRATFNGSYTVSDGRLELNALQSGGGNGTTTDPNAPAAQDVLSSLHLVYNHASRTLTGDVFVVGGHKGIVSLKFDPNQSATSGGTFQNQNADILRREYALIVGPKNDGIYTGHVANSADGSFDFYLRMFVEDLSTTNPVLRASYTLDCNFNPSQNLRRNLGGTINMEYDPPRVTFTSRGVDQPYPGNYMPELNNGSFLKKPDGSIDYGTINTTFVSASQGISVPVVLFRTNKAPPNCGGLPPVPPPPNICKGCGGDDVKPKPKHPKPPVHHRRNARAIEELGANSDVDQAE